MYFPTNMTNSSSSSPSPSLSSSSSSLSPSSSPSSFSTSSSTHTQSSPSTPPCRRLKHRYLKEFKVSSSTKDTFTLDWQVAPEFEPIIDGFSVRYRASGSTIVQYTHKMEHNTRTLDLGHLHENTDYEICLWASFMSAPVVLLNTFQAVGNLTGVSSSSSNLSSATLPLLDFEEMPDDPISYKNGHKVFPYCLEAATGLNGAWVALGSAIAATIVIGLIVFLVFLASCQNSSKKQRSDLAAVQNLENNTGEFEKILKRKKKWWLFGKQAGPCLLTRSAREKELAREVQKDEGKLSCEGKLLKSGLLTSLKKKKKGFRMKNQLHSSRSVLGCQIDGNMIENAATSGCHCGQKHKKSGARSKKRHPENFFGSRENNSSAHSSLLSLIQDEPGNCYLVATAAGTDCQDKSPADQQITHELAYLIPIMKCQDGTYVLGSDPSHTDALVDLPLSHLVTEDGEEYDVEADNEDLGEPFDGDFDLLPVVFPPEFCLSVVDSVYVGDVIACDEEGAVLSVVSEKMEGSESPCQSEDEDELNGPTGRSLSFVNKSMPVTDV